MNSLISRLMVILVAMCFIASPALAEYYVNGDIDQYGPRNDAEIQQVDADNMNFAYIYQNSNAEGLEDGNDALINQNGVENYYYSVAWIYQDGHENDAAIVQTNGMDNYAGISQYGSHNRNKVQQDGVYNTAHISVYGAYNKGQVLQPGDSNYGSVTQGIEGDFATYNEAIVFQSGYDNEGHIYQTGEGAGWPNNKAEVNQSGDMNFGDIEQHGTHGEAKIWQHPDDLFNGDGPTGENNHATITQESGDSNKAFVNQDGNENFADIIQAGDANQASIKQINGGSRLIAVSNNHASIEQRGDGNKANILQTQNGLNNNAPEFEPATIYQENNDNEASITQTDSNSQVASISQYGTANLALIHQSDGDALLFNQNAPHRATIYQGVGLDNQAVILQKGELAMEDEGPMHVADITQYGEHNRGWITQGTSVGNFTTWSASIYQNGDDNRALITQGDMPQDTHDFEIDPPMDPMWMTDFMDIPPPSFPWALRMHDAE